MLSQFDLLIAALTRQHNFILLTADQDFIPVHRLSTENWIDDSGVD
jgi:predicted nucleic acid-binding protein